MMVSQGLVDGLCLRLAFPKVESETRTWVQVVYLRVDLGTRSEEPGSDIGTEEEKNVILRLFL